MVELSSRCVVVGSVDRCLHAADLWRAVHGHGETFTPDQASEAVAASAPKLFGDSPGIIALDAHTWPSSSLDAVVQTASGYMLCVSPSKKLTATQRRIWQARGELSELDDIWRDAAIADMFSAKNITLDRPARLAITRSGVDIGRIRSLVFSAANAGITVLDERKTLILLGNWENSPGLFGAVDTCIDKLEVPARRELDGIDAVLFAQQLAETLRGALCVAQAGVRGTEAAALVGTPAFTAKKLTKRSQMNRARLKAGFEAACDADLLARTGAVGTYEVAVRVVAALCARPQ